MWPAWCLLALGAVAPGVLHAGRSLEVPVPGTALQVALLGRQDHTAEVSLWIGRTEVPWELLDAFVFEKVDPQQAQPADAVARPSKPYISMDRGFGHAGYPAICVSQHTAKAFCDWLSGKTGRRFRLPTVRELRSICGDATIDDAVAMDARCWHAGNAKGTTHPVDSGQPVNGFHALLGNVAEWAVADDGTLVLWGGSYLDTADDLSCDRIQRPTPAWNASDPQMPPSRWWLADAPFAGLRLVCEPLPSEQRQRSPGVQPAAPDGRRTETMP
jgi:hypothetical protein